MIFVLGHRSGTLQSTEQGADRKGGKMKAGCLDFWELVEEWGEGNFMCLKFVNLIMLIDTDPDPDQIKLNSRLLFTFMCHSISMLFLRWKKKKERNDNRK